MRSTSNSLDDVDDGDGGGGEAGGDGTRARRGTGRCAPGGGAGRATQGLGPSHARYRDNMLARGRSPTASRRVQTLFIFTPVAFNFRSTSLIFGREDWDLYWTV